MKAVFTVPNQSGKFRSKKGVVVFYVVSVATMTTSKWDEKKKYLNFEMSDEMAAVKELLAPFSTGKEGSFVISVSKEATFKDAEGRPTNAIPSGNMVKAKCHGQRWLFDNTDMCQVVVDEVSVLDGDDDPAL
jgi:hypothetical protein